MRAARFVAVLAVAWPLVPGRLHSPLARALVIASLATVLVTACATGERPTLVDEPSLDDPAAQAVIGRLERAPSETFTATYDITPTLTNATTQATVIQQGQRRRVTVGDVDYFSDGPVGRTCSVSTTECVEVIEPARVSDLNITPDFWGPSMVERLQLDAARAVGGSQASTVTIAGQAATCADITLPAASGTGVVPYCALDSGVLARYAGADVRIELTSFSPVVDAAQLG